MTTGYLARFYPTLAAAFAALTGGQQLTASLLAADLAIDRTGADPSVDDLPPSMDLNDVTREWSSEERAEASRHFRREMAVSALKSAVGGRPEAAICDATLSIRDEQAILQLVQSAQGAEASLPKPGTGLSPSHRVTSVAWEQDRPWTAPASTLVLYNAGGSWGYRIYTEAGTRDGRLLDLGSDADFERAQATLLRMVTERSGLAYESVWVLRKPGWWSSDLALIVDHS